MNTITEIRRPARTVREWRDDALCREVDPELFHPGQGQPVREAKGVCAMCPVRTPCLQEALAIDDRPGGVPVSGVWGGTSEAERRAMRRANRRRDVAA